jgi:uncharacterized protein YhjY with autotransporter beta-barrel domain
LQTLTLNILGDQIGVRTSFDVTVIDDVEAEQTESFAAQVLAVRLIDCDSGAQFNLAAEAPIPILDDDLPSNDGIIEFADLPLSVAENGLGALVVINRIDGGQGEISYDWGLENLTATPGEDYESVFGTLTWPDGDTSPKSFQIPILDDTELEGDETVLVFLQSQSSSGGEPLQATLTIIDDEEPSVLQFQVTDIRVRENAGVAEAIVTRTGPAVGEVTVGYGTEPGTATAGQDYEATGGSLTWGDGDATPRSILVSIQEGQIAPGGETFSIRLFEPLGPAVLGAASEAIVTINPLVAGDVEFANTPLSVAENAGAAIVSVNRINGSDGVLSIPYYTSPQTAQAGTDYTAVTGTLEWADGDAAPKTFEVPVIDNQTADGDRILRVGLSLNAEAFLETELTIVDDDEPAGIVFAVTDLEVEEDAGSVIATVSRLGSNSGGVVTVDYATVEGTALADEDFTAATGTLTWGDGDTADKEIEIAITAGAIDAEAEDFTIVLSNVTGPATLGQASVATVSIAALTNERDISGIDTLTPNQKQLANWFDQTCPRLADSEGLSPDQAELVELCSLVRNQSLPDSELQEILDAINPEEIFAAATGALRLSVSQHGNLSQRINALRNGARGVDLSGLNLEIDGQVIAGQAIQQFFDGLVGGGASADESGSVWGRWGAFLNGRVSTGEKDETANESGFDYDLQGITLGVDYRIRDNLIFGVAGGLGGVDSDYHGNGGGLDIESWNASAFLTYFRDESFYADVMMTYGENDYDSKRNILFDAGDMMLVDRTAKGDTDGTQFSFGFGLGWDFSKDAWTYGPHAGLYHYRVEVDGFEESGAGGLDLAIGDQEVTSLTGNAGGHLSYALLTDWGVLVPNARVDWVREFEDGTESLSYGFVNDPFVADPGDPSPTITLRSDRPDSSYFILAAGVSAQFIHGISGFVNYQTYSGYSDFTISEWNFGLRWEKTY